MAMKTALHSISYAGAWAGQARLTLDDFLHRAKMLGYQAVMLMAKRPHLSVLDYDADARRRLRDQLDKLGLQVACLAGYTDFGLDHERPGIPIREMQIGHVRELSRLASDIGCKLIRVFTGYDTAAASFDQQWSECVTSLRECARDAAKFGVTIGVQNHHDTAVDYLSLIDLLQEIGEPNCKAMFDAWAPALQGTDLVAAAKKMAPYTVHTTVADYVLRPRFRYHADIINYTRETDAVRAVPMGEGFIDYRSFFKALQEGGFKGYAAYEMCSYLRGGGSEQNLDGCARKFLDYMANV
jgi:sugar phosphate isomerase/epimerase